MTTEVQLDFEHDINGYNAFAPGQPSVIFSATIVSATPESVTVPTTHARWVIAYSFQPGSNVWVSNGHTAAVPAGSTFAATNSELNPGARVAKAGDVISLVTNNTSADVSVGMYAVSYP